MSKKHPNIEYCLRWKEGLDLQTEMFKEAQEARDWFRSTHGNKFHILLAVQVYPKPTGAVRRWRK